MPSTRSDRPAVLWPVLLIAGAGCLLFWGLGRYPDNPVPLMLLAAILFLLAPLACRAQRVRARGSCRAMLMVVLGAIGMVAGSMHDIGPSGLLTLASWCSATSGFSPGGTWAKLGMVPWTYAGMLIGCNLGMLLADTQFRSSPQEGMILLLPYAACNAGMLAGMLAVEALIPWLASGPAWSATTMLLVMSAGMSAGMLFSRRLTAIACSRCGTNRLLRITAS